MLSSHTETISEGTNNVIIYINQTMCLTGDVRLCGTSFNVGILRKADVVYKLEYK